MQKFTITVADVNIRVTTDEKPEMVDAVVDLLNDRIRDIITKSPGCSRNEAAILCALDYCARNLKDENRLREEQNAARQLRDEIAYLRRENDALTVEIARMREVAEATAQSPAPSPSDKPDVQDASSVTDDTADTHAAIHRRPPAPGTEALLPNRPDSAEPSTATDAPEESSSPVPAQDVMFNSENAPDTPQHSRRPPRSGNSTSKKRVGDMFDMLTFKDI